MKRKILYALIGVLVIGCVAFVTRAVVQRGKHRRMHAMANLDMTRSKRMYKRAMANLDLTDEQKEKMQDIKSKHEKALIDLHAAAKKAMVDARDLRNQDNPTASDIQAKVDALMAAKGKVLAREIQRGVEVKNALTPEQREKLGDRHLMQKGRKGFRGRGGYGFRGRGGFRGHRGWMHDHDRSEHQSDTKEAPEHQPSKK